MHIYAFGSVVRGDISVESDIDLLAVVSGHDFRFDPANYSIYSYERIGEIWRQGNPFAWHLSLESKLLYSSDQSDFLLSLGTPGVYRKCFDDCMKFYSLFQEARASFEAHTGSKIFDLSMVFLAIRNFATCFSLGSVLDRPDFSRNSALRLGEHSLSISRDSYKIMERARILCTRAIGSSITDVETELASSEFFRVEEWMTRLLREFRKPCETSSMTA